MPVFLRIFWLVGSSALAVSARAETPPPPGPQWSGVVAPYIWAFGIDGDVGAGEASGTIDSSVFDIMGDSDTPVALQGYGELRYGRAGVFLDGSYADITTAFDIGVDAGPVTLDLDVDTDAELTILEAGLLYRVVNPTRLWTPSAESRAGLFVVDALAGARYTAVDLDVQAEAWGGYRALGQKYDEGSGTSDLSLDVVLHGPVIGMTLRW